MRIGAIGAGPVGIALVAALKRVGKAELIWYVRNDPLRERLSQEGVGVSFQELAGVGAARYAPDDPERMLPDELSAAPSAVDMLREVAEREPAVWISLAPEELVSTPEALVEAQPDITLACVKAQAVLPLRARLAAHLRGLHFFVVNGFWLHAGIDLGVMYGGGYSAGNRAFLIPRGRLALGRTKSPHADFVVAVRAEGSPGTLVYRHEDLELLESLAGFFDPAVLRVESCPDIYPLMLRKAALNSLVNPLASLAGQPNGVLLMREARPIAAVMAQEIVRVLAAASMMPPGNRGFGAEELLQEFDRVCTDTAGNLCSQLVDRALGRPDELRYLNRLLLSVAQRYGIPMPLNAAICGLLQLPPLCP